MKVLIKHSVSRETIQELTDMNHIYELYAVQSISFYSDITIIYVYRYDFKINTKENTFKIQEKFENMGEAIQDSTEKK